MENLVGKLEFSDAILENANASLAEQGVVLPEFGDVGATLSKELNEVPELTQEESKCI